MLQIARLAPRQLGESRDLVATFFREHLNPDGAFQDRTGASDLYYTVFGLDGLIALQEDISTTQTEAYLRSFGAGETLDFVHLACLARAWAALRRLPDAHDVSRMLQHVERHRSDDGGYATSPGEQHGSAYAAYLALGIYQDLGAEVPDGERVIRSLQALRAADGGFANLPGQRSGITTATAAAILVTRNLGGSPDRDSAMWLLDRCHTSGGFFASPNTPVPDLLSTATALHALSVMHVPLAGLAEPCLDFVDSLWTNRGGFYGHWADDAADCEYTYYALLALGHLSMRESST
jgi:hypothetical protein